MCGIAGYSIRRGTGVDPSLLAKLLLAGLAERGEDASGYAWRGPDGSVEVVKRALPPHEFLASVPIHVKPGSLEAIVHVRDHTKGRPSHHGNNHPIRHGSICGVHNGIIQNDDELFEQFHRTRALPGMSVDSEAIFMLLDALPRPVEAFDHLVGSYSTAWFDDREPDTLQVARGRGRPLVLAHGDGVTVFASTRHAVTFASRHLQWDLGKPASTPHGTLLRLGNGRVQSRERFRVQPFDESRSVSYSTSDPQARLARGLAGRPSDGRAHAT